MNECAHKWQFQHVVYWEGRALPGSSAAERILGDRYFCEQCLATRITNERIAGNTYSKPIEGTFPK